jgi:hypothetical protein
MNPVAFIVARDPAANEASALGTDVLTVPPIDCDERLPGGSLP